MNRCLGWAALVMLGILLGVASSSHQTSKADDPAVDAAKAANVEVVAELKEIKTQLKEINEHLRTGVTKTIAVMNP